MNSLTRKPTIIVIPPEHAVVIVRNIRRSMRNNGEIIERWKRRQDRQRIQKEVVRNGCVQNKRKM